MSIDVIFTIFLLLIFILISIILVVSLYFLYRNDKAHKFSRELIQMSYDYNIRRIDENPMGDYDDAFEWFANKYSYEKLLFSFMPLKLEYWFTQEELDKINS